MQFIFECILQILGELIVEYFFTKYKKWTWWLWAVFSLISGVALAHYTDLLWWQFLLLAPIIGLVATILLILPVHLGIKLSAKAEKKKAKKH